VNALTIIRCGILGGRKDAHKRLPTSALEEVLGIINVPRAWRAYFSGPVSQTTRNPMVGSAVSASTLDSSGDAA